jgi:short-subunit dehydrogenase
MEGSRSVKQRYGPWALVVGASDGIGAAFATELAGRGLNLVLVARRPAPLAELAATLPTQTRVLAADAGTAEGMAAIADAPEDIGLVVCNAAAAPIAEFLELSAADHDAILNLNCRAAAQLAHAYGRRFRSRGSGGLVLLSSLASEQGSALVAHYAATKAYLRVLAEGLWSELRPHGVDVLACCPGLVRTPTYEREHPTPPRLVPPPLDPADVARTALRALGRRPVVIPGWRNRLTARLARAMPRRFVIGLASSQTAAIYRHRSR